MIQRILPKLRKHTTWVSWMALLPTPHLMAKEGIKGEDAVMKHYLTICELVDGGDVSAEVLGTEVKEVMKKVKSWRLFHPQHCGKSTDDQRWCESIEMVFPTTALKPIAPGVFLQVRTILAAKAGANYVSPFIGRIDDSKWDGVELIKSNCTDL